MSDRKILIVVSGGLVQEVFITEDDDTQIILIDWDNVKEGDIGSSPWSEWHPGVLTPAEFKKHIEEAEKEHAGRRVCCHCNVPLIKGFKVVHDESTCPTLLWQKNDIQFPRLLAEIHALGLTDTQKFLLAKSMDLEPEQIDELLNRAEAEFERLKPKKVEEAVSGASGTVEPADG